MLTLDQSLLNQGQQAAADGFFEFLFSADKELILSGPGGTGKTFLMGHLIDRVLPQYFQTCQLMGIQPEYDSVEMTATTNKAAEVLGLATKRPTQTIHSFLNLKPTDDLVTGQTKLTKTTAWTVHSRKIIFIDECSMIDGPLYQMIQEGTHKSKIVYVGDHCQLAPVKETLSPIYRQGLPFFELTEPMRNAEQPALMAVCQQLRNTVETGAFQPIQIVPGVIDWLEDVEMQAMIDQTFQSQTRDNRILAYTNERVVQYNEHIRNLRGLPGEYTEGELLVNNQAIRLGKQSLSVEEEVEILDLDAKTSQLLVEETGTGQVSLEVRNATLKTRLGNLLIGVPLPVDRAHYASLLRYYQRTKNWNRYFFLKGKIPDLRPRDAATVHKAQGSTYETVFVDVGNLSTCHLPQVVARLLYVGFSRARKRVILYGNLAEKYGGLVL